MQTRKPLCSIRAITEFVKSPRAPIAIRVIDCTVAVIAEIIAGIDPIEIQEITLPDGMHPVLEAGEHPGVISVLKLPRELKPGQTLSAIVRIPRPDDAGWDFASSTPPEKITVRADGDDLVFRPAK